jgi:hypothetical protein
VDECKPLLVGIFMLCMVQEGLYYFRTQYSISSSSQTLGELATPILPKPFR